MITKIEDIPHLPMLNLFKYLGPVSSVLLLSTSRAFRDGHQWDILCAQLRLNDIDSINNLSSRSKVILSLVDLNIICVHCGSLLDSIFGFFLYSNNKCFDCKRNKTLHNFYDKDLHIPATDDQDDHRHYIETFNIDWVDKPISGNYIMTAYGCTLGT